MVVTLKHKDSGIIKQAKLGFSWTTLFFGIFPALFRGDWKWGLIMFVVAMCTFGFSWLIFPFVYNKIYIKELLEKGYIPSSEDSKKFLIQKNILIN